MNPVVRFEIPTEDQNRIADFYTEAFGWKAQALGSDRNEYVLVTTTETENNSRSKNPGVINGGFYKKSVNMPAQYPTVVITVNNIKESMDKVIDAGGKILDEPVEIPGYGIYVSFFDTEGNRLSMMQPNSEWLRINDES